VEDDIATNVEDKTHLGWWVCFDEASCGLVNEVGFSEGEEKKGGDLKMDYFIK